LPVEADLLDAEIILGSNLEAELLGVENDFLPGQVLAGNGRRLVITRLDREGKRLLSGQPELVLPAKFDLPRALDQGRRARHGRSSWRRGLAIHMRLFELAAGGGRERRPASLDQRHRSAPHVL